MMEKVGKQDIHPAESDKDAGFLDGINYIGNKGPCLGARHAIIITMAIGGALIAATKTTFSVIIVAMTTNTSSNPDIPTYDWNNKGVIISSISWLGIPIQLVAGQIGKQYGHKWFIMGSTAINAVFFMLIPAFAKIGGSTGVIVSRIIGGAAIGFLGPIAGCINGIWVPAEERSKAGMIGIGAAFLIVMVAYLLTGQISASSWGYPAAFYMLGGLNLLWCVLWFFIGHQSPATHPRITPEERKYIETSLSLNKTKDIPTPWVKFLKSINFWAPVIAAIGVSWVDTVLSSANALYVTKAWNIDIAKGTSILAAAPVMAMLTGIFIAPFSDYLINKKILRPVNARRIFHTVGIVGTTLCLLWMTWISADSMLMIVLNSVISNICTLIFNVGGASLNILDIAPTFVGVIGGFSSTISQCVALFAPMTMDWVVKDENDPASWRNLFYITALITISTTIFFNLFATDKRKWENLEEEDNSQ